LDCAIVRTASAVQELLRSRDGPLGKGSSLDASPARVSRQKQAIRPRPKRLLENSVHWLA